MQEYAKHLLDGCYIFRLRSGRKKARGLARVFSEVRTILQIASPPRKKTSLIKDLVTL